MIVSNAGMLLVCGSLSDAYSRLQRLELLHKRIRISLLLAHHGEAFSAVYVPVVISKNQIEAVENVLKYLARNSVSSCIDVETDTSDNRMNWSSVVTSTAAECARMERARITEAGRKAENGEM